MARNSSKEPHESMLSTGLGARTLIMTARMRNFCPQPCKLRVAGDRYEVRQVSFRPVVRRSVLSCCPNNRPPKSLIWAVGRGGSIDGGRISKPYTGSIEGGTHNNHSGTLVAVMRAISVPRSQPRRLLSTGERLVAAGSNLAGKASEPF